MKTLDQYGVMGQIQKHDPKLIEGGDSACWNGHLAFMGGLHETHLVTVDQYVKFFEPNTDGVWVRHPEPKNSIYGWAAYQRGVYDGVISRDQLTGILGALCPNKKYAALWRLVKAQAKRGFIFTNNTIKNNTDPKIGSNHKPNLIFFLKCISGQIEGRKFPDVTLFDIWAMIIRGFYPYSFFMYPLLIIFDIQTVVGAILVRRESVQQDSDILAHFTKCFLAKKIMMTPTMWIAHRINNNTDLLRKAIHYWCGKRKNCFIIQYYQKFL